MKKLFTMMVAVALVLAFSSAVLADPSGKPGDEDSYITVVVHP